jgi:archaemetzincin
MGLNTRIGSSQPAPEYAYKPGRPQYDALAIVKALAGESESVPLILRVTRYDICTPILTYVFGESQLGGRAALISLCRIAGDNPEATYGRIVKIGLHEVGQLATTCGF